MKLLTLYSPTYNNQLWVLVYFKPYIHICSRGAVCYDVYKHFGLWLQRWVWLCISKLKTNSNSKCRVFSRRSPLSGCHFTHHRLSLYTTVHQSTGCLYCSNNRQCWISSSRGWSCLSRLAPAHHRQFTNGEIWQKGCACWYYCKSPFFCV